MSPKCNQEKDPYKSEARSNEDNGIMAAEGEKRGCAYGAMSQARLMSSEVGKGKQLDCPLDPPRRANIGQLDFTLVKTHFGLLPSRSKRIHSCHLRALSLR